MQVTDNLASNRPKIINMTADSPWGQLRQRQMLNERSQVRQQHGTSHQVGVDTHPGARPVVQVAAED